MNAPRRKSNRDRLLDLLSDRLPHDSRACYVAAGFRYSARLLELRQAGHEILTERVGDDEFRYTLIRLAGEAAPLLDHHGQALLALEVAA